MNPGSSPGRILRCHQPNESLKLCRDFRPAGPRARKEAPVPPEAGAMPAHDGLRLYDQQRARPSGPQAPEGEPKKPIPPGQLGSRVLAFENGDLMTQGNKLKSEIVPRGEECAQPSK
jgi:hypothetical protein